MKSLIKTTLIIFTLVIILLVGGVLVISKFARGLEEKTGLASYNDEQKIKEELSNVPPERAGPELIEVFTPLQHHVYKDQKIKLQGAAQSKSVLVTLNSGKSQVVSTNQDGKFEVMLSLQEGSNVLDLLILGPDGSPFEKQMMIGNYPKKDDNKEYVSYVGQIMGIDKKEGTFNISVGKDLIKIKTALEKLEKLEITSFAGVISERSKKDLVALDIRSGNFPLYSHGFIKEKKGEEIIFERKREGGNQFTATLVTKTSLQKWDGKTTNIYATDSINPGDRVFLSRYAYPKEDKNQVVNLIILPK